MTGSNKNSGVGLATDLCDDRIVRVAPPPDEEQIGVQEQIGVPLPGESGRDSRPFALVVFVISAFECFGTVEKRFAQKAEGQEQVFPAGCRVIIEIPAIVQRDFGGVEEEPEMQKTVHEPLALTRPVAVVDFTRLNSSGIHSVTVTVARHEDRTREQTLKIVRVVFVIQGETDGRFILQRVSRAD